MLSYSNVLKQPQHPSSSHGRDKSFGN
ncbi:hypothetical protein VULLAG_LOCUS16969 [Vulpes lagopus]